MRKCRIVFVFIIIVVSITVVNSCSFMADSGPKTQNTNSNSGSGGNSGGSGGTTPTPITYNYHISLSVTSPDAGFASGNINIYVITSSRLVTNVVGNASLGCDITYTDTSTELPYVVVCSDDGTTWGHRYLDIEQVTSASQTVYCNLSKIGDSASVQPSSIAKVSWLWNTPFNYNFNINGYAADDATIVTTKTVPISFLSMSVYTLGKYSIQLNIDGHLINLVSGTAI